MAPTTETKLIDVAGGTGDIAFRFTDRVRKIADPKLEYRASVQVVDINDSMLQVGRQRSQKLGYGDREIKWECANAESLPFNDGSFDAYTIAFGIRNCTNIDQVLREAYRVLKPGGRLLVLEFGKVTGGGALVSGLYDTFSFQVIPRIGELVANDADSYKYLVESIRKFPSQPQFAGMIREAGFEGVEWEDQTFGIAAIHSGWKLEFKNY